MCHKVSYLFLTAISDISFVLFFFIGQLQKEEQVTVDIERECMCGLNVVSIVTI
uniref:Uncharacterized protein n=1 Tax=Anguilla anguilla TaxID=7936 RepID=A0A0E9VPI5_ANGAN